jgi:hypothetical protein
MKYLVIPLACLTLASCSGSIDPKTWTCDSLIGPVIAMSKDKDVKILEIESPTEETKSSEEIRCTARAELSNGGWFITYGAHVSDGGQIVLEYQQKH